MSKDKGKIRREALEELAGILMAISVISRRLSRTLLAMSVETGKGEENGKED